MAINMKIMDKIVEKTRNDFNARIALTAILEEENEGLSAHAYKDTYKEIIKNSLVEEEKEDEN